MTVFIKFWTLVTNILCIPLHLMDAVGLYGIYKRIFPVCQYRMSVKYNEKMHEKKQELFRSLSEFKKPGGRLSVLEFGCGSGTNFQYYPAGSRVICTDPNPHFQKYLKKSMEENGHLTYAKFAVASGEDMGAIEDESVDTVVCTLVLCTVNDVQQTLREAHRILRPGGGFFFMEHVTADPSTWLHFFQHVLQPLWFYFGDGCMITRETWTYLEEAGFSSLKLSHIEAPFIQLIKPHIMGYAVK
ncbi:methyltransferase-like protein 7A [Salarias fasciatus]|uniref:Methyltransferase-like protein 7A n=1 Tax=Salarias fasciatus TaxID=181472 RepID=A0A672IVX3_SALFA|nr:methyltransferase-like protein 7A [Salarias fasciatus]